MYIIVTGMDSISASLIEIATEGGNEVVIVERGRVKTEAAATMFGCLILDGDATVKQAPGEAGADRTDAIVTMTGRDTTSIMVCLLARELDIPDIVSVAHDSEHMNLCRQIGVDMMEDPQRLAAEYLYCAVKCPFIVGYICIGEYAKVFEVHADEDAPITGMMIQEAAQENLLDGDTLIVAVECEGDDDPVTSCGNIAIGTDNLLTVYSVKGATPEVTDVLSYYKDH